MLKRYFLMLAASALASFLVACSSNNNSDTQNNQTPTTPQTPEAQVLAMEDSGEITKLDRTDSLLGTDSNNNGIRDDIDTYINQTFTNPKEQKAVRQLASALQATLSVGTILDEAQRREQAKQAALTAGRAQDCVYITLSQSDTDLSRFHDITTKLESYTANTKPRLQAYLAYDSALDGTVHQLQDEGVCDE